MNAGHSASAVWFAQPRRAELRPERIAAPLPDEVQVQAEVSLVSAGTEMTVYRGQTVSPGEVELETMAGTHPFPVKYGYQVVGRVVATGDRSGFGIGDRVFCYHPHQNLFNCWIRTRGVDFMVGSAPLVFPIPDTVSFDQAAFANLFAVAFNATLDAPVRYGDVVVVSGLGVIGHFLAGLVRPIVGKLVLIDPLESRRERARYLGADAVVPPQDAAAAVAELSSGRGADQSYEVSGAAAALQTVIDVTGQEGTIVVVSYYGSREVRLRLAPEFHFRRHRVISSFVGAIGSRLQPRWDDERRMSAVMDLLAGVDVSRLLSHREPFANAPAAYERIDQHPEETLAILLDYRGGDLR